MAKRPQVGQGQVHPGPAARPLMGWNIQTVGAALGIAVVLYGALAYIVKSEVRALLEPIGTAVTTHAGDLSNQKGQLADIKGQLTELRGQLLNRRLQDLAESPAKKIPPAELKNLLLDLNKARESKLSVNASLAVPIASRLISQRQVEQPDRMLLAQAIESILSVLSAGLLNTGDPLYMQHINIERPYCAVSFEGDRLLVKGPCALPIVGVEFRHVKFSDMAIVMEPGPVSLVDVSFQNCQSISSNVRPNEISNAIEEARAEERTITISGVLAGTPPARLRMLPGMR